MASLVPERAIVRPRVRCAGTDSPRLLEEIVEECAEESAEGFLWLVGTEGAGKTTALAHLSEIFKDDEHFAFIDDADKLESVARCEDYCKLGEDVLVVAARRKPISTGHKILQLEPWRVDELIEYLLATHQKECGEILERLGDDARQAWKPGIARIVLEQLVDNRELRDATSALLEYLHRELADEEAFEAACMLCLAYQKGGSGDAMLTLPPSIRYIPPHVKQLLKENLVQVPLAAEQISSALFWRRSPRVLEGQLSLELVNYVGVICRSSAEVRRRLEKILAARKHAKCHSMAASILLAADPSWRPAGKRYGRNYSGAYFSKAAWPEISFASAHLELAEFFEADLAKACFDDAVLVETDFVKANLQTASLKRSLAVGADFDRANLCGADLSQIKLEQASLVRANLSEANLHGANLCGADLTGACFNGANLSEATLVSATLADVDFTGCDLRRADCRHADFRTAGLKNANMDHICLTGANLEDVVWEKARLQNASLRRAHLTGSRFRSANLRDAQLFEAGLGEIDWQGADLRGANLSGATFHMGSSRSGLVDSPIASEGSRTGFYTDDLEELYFKSPEEVRKANLRGADLRSANVTNVDFYLVDLRDAKLDPSQRKQASRTGAIFTERG